MPGLSDYNSPIKASRIVARTRDYSDLNLSLPIHPNKKDIIPLKDLDAIKQSLKNIILTNKGEKLFMPTFGGNITSYLFENPDVFTMTALRNEIEFLIKRFEKRIMDVTIQVTDDQDANAFNVTIGFKVINSQVDSVVEFALNRTR